MPESHEQQPVRPEDVVLLRADESDQLHPRPQHHSPTARAAPTLDLSVSLESCLSGDEDEELFRPSPLALSAEGSMTRRNSIIRRKVMEVVGKIIEDREIDPGFGRFDHSTPFRAELQCNDVEDGAFQLSPRISMRRVRQQDVVGLVAEQHPDTPASVLAPQSSLTL